MCVTLMIFPCPPQYEKEIKVINTAVAQCSNTLTKGKLDLKITAGEQLEVIDITEGNQLLCRNSEGKCKFLFSI